MAWLTNFTKMELYNFIFYSTQASGVNSRIRSTDVDSSEPDLTAVVVGREMDVWKLQIECGNVEKGMPSPITSHTCS